VPDAGEAAEVVIGRADHGAALQGERRDVDIRGEIAGAARGLQQAAQDRPGPLARGDGLDVGERSGGWATGAA
jgi:hypothetical protein